jgi:hypothetical protein
MQDNFDNTTKHHLVLFDPRSIVRNVGEMSVLQTGQGKVYIELIELV